MREIGLPVRIVICNLIAVIERDILQEETSEGRRQNENSKEFVANLSSKREPLGIYVTVTGLY